MTYEWVRLGDRQAGVITYAQLRAAGVSRTLLRQLVAGGLLCYHTRGLYVLAGAPASWRRSLWIALLRAGPGAFACRRSATALYGLDGVEEGFVDIGVPSTRRPRAQEVVRVRNLRPDHLSEVQGIPVTSVVRTLIDVGSAVPAAVVERALESAVRLRLAEMEGVIQLASLRTPGAAVMRQVLAGRPAGVPPTESDAETLFLQIARAAGLPEPTRQFGVAWRGRHYRLDFAWPPLRLGVEVDGADVHGPGRLTSDLRRQNRIVLGGWTLLRFSWAMITYEESAVRRDLVAAWRASALAV